MSNFCLNCGRVLEDSTCDRCECMFEQWDECPHCHSRNTERIDTISSDPVIWFCECGSCGKVFEILIPPEDSLMARITITEAAERLGYTDTSVLRHAIRNGYLKAEHPSPRVTMILESELNRWIAAGKPIRRKKK